MVFDPASRSLPDPTGATAFCGGAAGDGDAGEGDAAEGAAGGGPPPSISIWLTALMGMRISPSEVWMP